MTMIYRQSVPQLPCSQRYICEYFSELLVVTFYLHAWFEGSC